jgi:uncharacterized protein YecE (DUF72 family)
VKLWRGITHERGFGFEPACVGRFLFAARELWTKRGCLLVQLPPGVHADKFGQLERLLEEIVGSDSARGWRIAVEFRHPSWYSPETEALLERYRAGMVLQDMPASKLESPGGNTNFIYVRYHGVEGDYKGAYPETMLIGVAGKIQRWLEERRDVYVYFNNTIGDALLNAQALYGMVEDRGMPGVR